MKNMFVKSKNFTLLVWMLFCAAAIGSVQANTYVTFSVDMSTNVANGSFVPATMTVEVRGTFNGWADSGGPFGNGGVQLFPSALSGPGQYVYTNTVDDTVNPNGGTETYIFLTTSNYPAAPYDRYESLASGYNRNAQLPTNSGASLVLPTPYFNDLGTPVVSDVSFNVDMAQQVKLSNFVPTRGDQVVVQGIFNGWTSNTWVLTNSPTMITEPGGLVTNLVWENTFPITNSPAGIEQFKYIIDVGGTNNLHYESVGTLNKDPNSGNRYFAAVPQTLPRVYFADAPYTPTLVSNITFSVDMTIVALTDTNYNPASVTLDGDFTGWGDVGCTNNPLAANTNIYTATNSYTIGVGATMTYQYRYRHLDNPNYIVYDHASGGGNRVYPVVDTNPNGTNILSIWDDASLNDYILTPTPVYFSVDMTQATTHDLYVGGTNNVGPFQPSSDTVYINGQFVGWYAWSGGADNATAPAGYQMIRSNMSLIYTNTIVISSGTPVAFEYKYGTDPIGFDSGYALGGPADDEMGIGTNHFRVVRSTALNPYPMPRDTFGDAYREPYFNVNSPGGANLTVGASSGGAVPVTWLGRPGAYLQVRTSLTSGAWQDLAATDGTNWSNGYFSTNGFVSQTNYPTGGGAAYFRLVKP